MTPAEKEAYSHADDTRITLYTLELNHPAFTEPLRIVCDNDPLEAPLEDGVEKATFMAFWFTITRPPISEEPDPALKIAVDNVSGYLTPYMDAASRSGKMVDVIFRPYLVDQSEDTVTLLRTIRLQVRNATASMTSVSITAAYVNPANLPFPKELYTADRFPGLSR
ncbi:hypothetical protein CI610_00313 [invertebrate metagenome]|uniref:DUF1833 domain-containing protein n=1 Tax=invertebrate metagenome TaxID=1711999 RepID=A0A2H9TBN2_9ZZZZ